MRELYLIVKRGLPTILAVTLIAVVIAVAVMAIRPDSYEAEVTVVSSPTVVQAEGAGTLAFTPRSAIAFATY
ncbi:MAG: Wzz/FepE/Etk N-terminal domain-containing protein, partial [Trueperaceae bacterium]